MHQLLLLVHTLAAIAIVGLVLLQHGKGADVGAMFGSGAASGTFFGSPGSGGFLYKATLWIALLFGFTSITLTYLAAHTTATQQLPGVPQASKVIPLPSQKE